MSIKSKKKNDNHIMQLENEYHNIEPLANRFCDEIVRQITELLFQNQIPLGVPIQNRVKTLDSVKEKLERNSLYLGSIKELNDLIGIRIILLFQTHVTKACKIISDTFDKSKKVDTKERLKEDQFGYTSIHYTIELPKSWDSIPTFKGMEGIKAEIQVRTLAQHIWAASSHILQYKREKDIPPTVRRSIYRLSAQLETVDLELERVLQQIKDYKVSLTAEQKFEDPLNVNSLEKVLDSMLPEENKVETEKYSKLIFELDSIGINTTDNLEKFIDENLDAMLETDRIRVNNLRRKNKAAIRHGVASFTHTGLMRCAIKQNFKPGA